MENSIANDPPQSDPGQPIKRTRRFQPELSDKHAPKRGVRRGPRNRFQTQRDREEERMRITEMMGKGIKVATIATALQISVPTLYRRIKEMPRAAFPKIVDRTEEFEKKFIALMENAEVCLADAQYRAESRIKKHKHSDGCPDCINDKITVDLLRWSHMHQKTAIRALQHSGYFAYVRTYPEAVHGMVEKAHGKAIEALKRKGHQPETGAGIAEATTGSNAKPPTEKQSSEAVAANIKQDVQEIDESEKERRKSRLREEKLRAREIAYQRLIIACMKAEDSVGLSPAQMVDICLEGLTLALPLNRQNDSKEHSSAPATSPT